MSRRIMTTENLEEDVRIENHLRPQLLEDYIGQAKAKEMLKILFQRFGQMEQTFAFALLLTNVFGFTLDRNSERLLRQLRRAYLATRTKHSEKKSAQRA